MKKLILLFSICVLKMGAQTTATNFTVNDCAGNPHNLFNELDNGKVVVLSWVMPCSACIGPVVSAQTEIQNFLTSYPGQILFYVADDFGTTNCTSLNSWCSTNGITPNATFKNSAISMMDYGSNGMPKTIIIAGPNHQVFFNEDDALTVSNFNTAMNNALATTVGIKQRTQDIYNATVAPNPSSSSFELSFNLKDNSPVSIDIYNALGQKVRSIDPKGTIGHNAVTIKTDDLNNGAYFVKINNNDPIKVIVSH